jgi:hypothetical protein
VTRFLGGGLQGVVDRFIVTAVRSNCNGMVVSRDGSTLLVSDRDGGSHAIHEFRVSDGSRLRVIGGKGDGPLQFKKPLQVWIAPDDIVFVADRDNHRVQVLTPRLDFHAFIGVGELKTPAGVCANDAVVVVSETNVHRISVFSRGDGALLRRFGSRGSGDGELKWPLGLCFMSDERHVTVADNYNNRVSVLSVDGEFIRHVGMREVVKPSCVACTAYDEIVVADKGRHRVDELVLADNCRSRIAVFSASGELLKTMGGGGFSGLAVHGSTIFAQNYANECCVMFV